MRGTIEGPSSLRNMGRSFLRSPTGVLSALAILLLIMVAILGPLVMGEEAARTRPSESGMGPTDGHPFGTDRLGRDVLARTIVATRLSLQLGLTAAAIAFCAGVGLGAVIVTVRGRLREVLRRLLDGLLALPGELLAILVVAIIGPGFVGAVWGIGIGLAPYFARITSNLALSVVGNEYVTAARVLGVSTARITARHVLPNLVEQLLIVAATAVPLSIVYVAGLSFLGLGVQPPDLDWGRMLNEAIPDLYINPAGALAPGLAIVASGVVFGAFGEALARTGNPLLWTGRSRRRALRRRRPQGTPGATTVTGGGIEQAQSTEDLGTLLSVDALDVRFPRTDHGEVSAVRGVSLSMKRGETLGIVGESGSGKTTLGLAIAQLSDAAAAVSVRGIRFDNQDLRQLRGSPLARFLGARLAVIFQNPMNSFNPALRMERQLTEVLRAHLRLKKSTARERAVDRLHDVRLKNPEDRLSSYPAEFSGGELQRCMIAMGLTTEPSLILADEPTTALDVTVQAQIISLLREINNTRGTAIVVISHDVGVVAEVVERVLVMYAGRIVEDLTRDQLVDRRAAHPYTQALVAAVPDMTVSRERPLTAIPGRPPPLDDLPEGCAFAPRCPAAVAHCATHDPVLTEIGPGHRVACWVASESVVALPRTSDQPLQPENPHHICVAWSGTDGQ